MKKLAFFNLHDFLLSVVPGLLTIHSTIDDMQILKSLFLGIFVLLLFIALIIWKNVGLYKKEIADILASGYYINFLENLANNLNERDNKIDFGDHKIEQFDLDHIQVEIYLPASNAGLNELAKRLGNSKQLQFISLKNRQDNSGFWARAEKQGDVLVIKDFPRTLFSLPRYLIQDLAEEYSEKKSVRYHRVFNAKIKKLMAQNQQHRVLATYKMVYE